MVSVCAWLFLFIINVIHPFHLVQAKVMFYGMCNPDFPKELTASFGRLPRVGLPLLDKCVMLFVFASVVV